MTNLAELMFRQVIPAWIDDDRVSSQSFQPRPNVDQGILSVSAQSKCTPEASRNRFIENGGESAGVLAVQVEECEAAELEVHYDPLGPGDSGGPDDAHAGIDMRGLNRSQQRKRAKQLRNRAAARGWIVVAE